MSVDVTTETDIARPVDEVAGYSADPSNAPEWYANIDSVRWKTDPPVQRTAGQQIQYLLNLGSP